MLGILTFLDPPRPDTKRTIERAVEYGVKPALAIRTVPLVLLLLNQLSMLPATAFCRDNRSRFAKLLATVGDVSVDDVALRSLRQRVHLVSIGSRPERQSQAAFYETGHDAIIPFYPIDYRALRMWQSHAWRHGVAAVPAARGTFRPEFRLEQLSLTTVTVMSGFSAATPTAACIRALASVGSVKPLKKLDRISGPAVFGFRQTDVVKAVVRRMSSKLSSGSCRPLSTRAGATAERQLCPASGPGMRGTRIRLMGCLHSSRAFAPNSVRFHATKTTHDLFACDGRHGRCSVSFVQRQSFPPGRYQVVLPPQFIMRNWSTGWCRVLLCQVVGQGGCRRATR
eukprot:TRINITY_DN170_c0_g1_i3.p1 TRINITY_DN170_c0_g1~~TRINITY_DN170_c0_g1_i3.p1  ORF type:complete len:340 (-),score=51.30 TRINITY_DN170_c0_g1_i3:764-1783(-)